MKDVDDLEDFSEFERYYRLNDDNVEDPEELDFDKVKLKRVEIEEEIIE